MRAYQNRYIDNLKRVQELMDFPKLSPREPKELYQLRVKNGGQARKLIQENTALLRENLMPMLDDIVSVPEDTANELAEFAAALAGGVRQLDLVLGYTIHDALITYARHWKKREFLIQELYYTGLALFYMQSRIGSTGKHLYNWKIGLVFGEAAAYLKRYDEIHDMETRGFIHRAMANLALAYHNTETPAEAEKKAQIIRRSLRVLSDPAYHEKSPSLPWDVYITKSHQERTTLMTLLRTGADDSRIVREVMESAQYVWERQLENSRKRGTPVEQRWVVGYEAALYHCGVQPLTKLLQRMEDVYMERNADDYSDDGVYANIFHIGLYADYLRRDEELVWKKKEVLKYMYRMLMRYVQNAPNDQWNEGVTRNLLEMMKSFIEYPDGLAYKDFLLQMVVCRDPDAFVFARRVAEVSVMLMQAMIEQKPQELVGALGIDRVEEVAQHRNELLEFAYDSGMLHDVGMIAFGGVVRSSGRSWLEEEREMYACHAYAGYQMLRRCDSTRAYAQTALGHNAFFNGMGGYPKEYVRAKNPEAAVTDIVSAAAFLLRQMSEQLYVERPRLSAAEAVELAGRRAGERFSPAVCELAAELLPELEAYVEAGSEQAYCEAFRRLFGAQGA